MTAELVPFMQAISATGGWVAGLFFLRFWRESSDRLFLLFAMAFWLLSASWALLALTSPTEETRPYIYAIRLGAFLLLITAILDKNRAR
jgi:hypothetical protein